MKHHFLLIVFILLALSALVACDAVAQTDPNGEAPEQLDAVPVDEKISVDNCPEPAPGEHQLIYAAAGFCFLYPDNYDVFQGPDGSITLYVRSVLNTEAPVASIHFEALEGRSIQEVIPVYPSDADLATMSFLAIDLGEETATVLDNLPGQDTNRRVIAVHEDMVYDLLIARIGEEYGDVGEEAEVLYNLITSTFQFIGIEPDAPLLAGPECPKPVENSMLYTNEPAGYCLLVPGQYTAQTIDPEATEVSFFVDTIQDVTHAKLFITVEKAGGRSLEEVTADKEAEIETAIPGLDVVWTFGYMLDGVPANQFDQVPGQDLSRQVVLVRDDRLYTLSFVPDDPDAADAYAEMQTLYETVLDSFSFLWQS